MPDQPHGLPAVARASSRPPIAGETGPAVASCAESPAAPDRAARLAAAIAEGDSDALAELYEAWFDRALAMARAATRRDEAWCLDVVQDAFVRVIRAGRSLRALRTTADLDRWMARVVHTAALDLLRRESRRSAREKARAAPHDPAPDGNDVDERITELRGVLDRLDADDRALLRLRFVEDRTLESAGEQLSMTGGAAHGRIRRLLTRLRERLLEHHP